MTWRTRTRTICAGTAAAVMIVGAGVAQASVIPGSVTIDAAPTHVLRGTTFDVTFSWDHDDSNDGDHCNAYGATVTVAGVAQTASDYAAATLDCPGPNTRTESLTVPADAALGVTTLTVNVAEFFAGFLFDDETSQPITIVAGLCPSGGGWSFQSAQGPDDPYDTNGDGVICTKVVNGQGNSANSQRGGGNAEDIGHVDGHNHKDNNS